MHLVYYLFFKTEFEPKASIGSSVLREKRSHALSAEILGQMGDLVNVLSKANACKKEELDKLQAYVKKLQVQQSIFFLSNISGVFADSAIILLMLFMCGYYLLIGSIFN